MNNTFVRAFIAMSLFASLQANALNNSKDAANRLGASGVQEISFGKDSANMTEAQKSEIRAAIAAAAKNGKIDEVKILAWSDKEYPSEKGQQMKSDEALAKRRLQGLESFVKKDLKISKVDTYNMTERPNALEKLFNTSDAKVKQTAEAGGAAPTEGNTGFFDLKSQASKGVVLIFMKK